MPGTIPADSPVSSSTAKQPDIVTQVQIASSQSLLAMTEKIVGLLAKQICTVEQLAATLELGASTVSQNLAKEYEAGLVNATVRSDYNYYHLETGKIEAMARRLRAEEAVPFAAVEIGQNAYERKGLQDFLLPDGRRKTIPAQRKKPENILRHIAKEFEPGVRYKEKQINEIMRRYHEDSASLRARRSAWG